MLPALEQSHFQHNHTESEVGTKEFLSPVTAAGSDRHGNSWPSDRLCTAPMAQNTPWGKGTGGWQKWASQKYTLNNRTVFNVQLEAQIDTQIGIRPVWCSSISAL